MRGALISGLPCSWNGPVLFVAQSGPSGRSTDRGSSGNRISSAKHQRRSQLSRSSWAHLGPEGTPRTGPASPCKGWLPDLKARSQEAA